MFFATPRYLEFMSREEAHKKLIDMCPGTFIIRFSDGEVGGVSIAWVIEKEGGGEHFFLLIFSRGLLIFGTNSQFVSS